MTHIDTSAEACERWAQHMANHYDRATAALIRQLVRERDEARERALDEAAAEAEATLAYGSPHAIPSCIRSMKGNKK